MLQGSNSPCLKSVRVDRRSDHCLICLERFDSSSIRGLLDCTHNQFCYHCILGWAERTNKCPVCSVRFSRLFSSKQRSSWLSPIEGMQIEDRDQLPEEEDDPAENPRPTLCQVCELEISSDQPLECATCAESFHLRCLRLKRMPELQLWFCDDCLKFEPKHVQTHQNLQISSVRRPLRKRQAWKTRHSRRHIGTDDK